MYTYAPVLSKLYTTITYPLSASFAMNREEVENECEVEGHPELFGGHLGVTPAHSVPLAVVDGAIVAPHLMIPSNAEALVNTGASLSPDQEGGKRKKTKNAGNKKKKKSGKEDSHAPPPPQESDETSEGTPYDEDDDDTGSLSHQDEVRTKWCCGVVVVVTITLFMLFRYLPKPMTTRTPQQLLLVLKGEEEGKGEQSKMPTSRE